MKIIYYYHIPKCGGTLINQQLKDLAITLGGEYYDLDFRMTKFCSSTKDINDSDLKLFLSRLNDKTNDYKFVHHHHGYFGISEISDILLEVKKEAILQGNEFHLFTCVRDPLSFQLSRVNYLKNSCGMPDFSFDDVCTNSMHQNFMFKYFLYNHPKRWEELNLDKQSLLTNLDLMDKVFVLEELRLLYDWLEQIVGIQIQSRTKKVNVGTHSLKPTERQLEVLKQVNTLDQFFYDTVKSGMHKVQIS